MMIVMDTRNKEQIHDEEIAPLMAQVIAVCKANGIAMLATFAIPTEENPALACTTILPDESGHNPDRHSEAFDIIYGNNVGAMTITKNHADGSKVVTAFL